MAPANQVYVQVKYGLAGTRSYVEHSPIAFFNAALACDAGCNQMTTTN